MQPGTRIHVASCSKPITSMALSKALNDRSLDETAPLSAIFVDRGLHPTVAELTVTELLSHRSGLSPAADASVDDILGQPLPERARRSRVYANINFSIARSAIEALVAEPYATHVQRAVFAPAGVTAATLSPEAGEVAFSYRLGDQTEGRPIAFDFSKPAGPFGWYLTPEELAKVAYAYAAGAIAPAELAARMMQKELGWDAMTTPAGTVYAHGGRWIGPGGVGAVSGIAVFPDGRAAGFLMNANSTLDGGALLANIFGQTTPHMFSYSVPDSGIASVHLSIPAWADALHYSLDGAAPTIASPRYEGVIRASTPGRLVAVAFRDGRAISEPGALELKVVRRAS